MIARSIIEFVFVCFYVSLVQCRQRIKVRLDGGNQPYAGRVMVYYANTWGGICDNGWSKKNAEVICRQLGYQGVVLYTKGKFYGRQPLYIGPRGSRRRRTRIWLDRISCNGRENNLGNCLRGHNRWGQVRCSRRRLAGVMCDPGMKILIKTPSQHNMTHNIDIKKFHLTLLPKKTTNKDVITEGLLMINYGGKKTGMICSNQWDTKDSRVACGELGFTHAVKAENLANVDEYRNQYQFNLNFHMGDVACNGNEASLLSCKSSGLRAQTCSSGQAVWLKCETKTPIAHVRLHAGVVPWEGRVEVHDRGKWATVCDKDMDILTANVICRSLGHGTAKEYALGTVYAHAMDDMKIYEAISCTGMETHLHSCIWTSSNPPRYPHCRHYSDAGVKCNVPKKRNHVEIRLGGSRDYNTGRVEVKVSGKWRIICGDRWTMMNSVVTCRQLGLGHAVANYSTSHYGTNGTITWTGVTCLGHEASLDQCLRHETYNCSQTKRVAAVRCKKVAPDLVWDITELKKTMTIRTFPIASLRCAYEEKCLASSADDQFNYIRLRRDWLGYLRRLLRFSAKVHNVGTAAYRPYLQKNAWQWHSCHRHYHSDEEFAFYDLIDPHTHKKMAEGHKASYCLEDTKCDEGVDQFYFCENRGDQGISVNCHDNYDYTLDCQWVDVTDLTASGRSYKLRLVANPALKVGESDYSNNVILCDVIDRGRHVTVGACLQETCVSGVRSHHGNGNFACCRFPFIYKGLSRDTCLHDNQSGQFWCATSANFDQDGLFGYC